MSGKKNNKKTEKTVDPKKTPPTGAIQKKTTTQRKTVKTTTPKPKSVATNLKMLKNQKAKQLKEQANKNKKAENKKKPVSASKRKQKKTPSTKTSKSTAAELKIYQKQPNLLLSKNAVQKSLKHWMDYWQNNIPVEKVSLSSEELLSADDDMELPENDKKYFQISPEAVQKLTLCISGLVDPLLLTAADIMVACNRLTLKSEDIIQAYQIMLYFDETTKSKNIGNGKGAFKYVNCNELK